MYELHNSRYFKIITNSVNNICVAKSRYSATLYLRVMKSTIKNEVRIINVMTRNINEIIEDTKKLAREYYLATHKPLGVTSEIGEYEASKILKLSLAEARQPGFDALDRYNKKVQIKSRCIYDKTKISQRTGTMKCKKEWDYAILVLLDEYYNAYEIYKANKPEIVNAINVPGSKSRNERETLAIGQFKRIANLEWKRS